MAESLNHGLSRKILLAQFKRDEIIGLPTIQANIPFNYRKHTHFMITPDLWRKCDMWSKSFLLLINSIAWSLCVLLTWWSVYILFYGQLSVGLTPIIYVAGFVFLAATLYGQACIRWMVMNIGMNRKGKFKKN
jgi:hypothetical protein